jgi:uncharacterized membrane protein
LWLGKGKNMTETKGLKSKRDSIREMTILAMFIAIIAVMGFVPWLGFIPIFGVSATIIHIPVLIGGTLLGRRSSMILGLAFGLVSFARAFTSVGFDYVFIFPWVSILPRFILGLIIYDVVRLFRKIIKPRIIAFGVAFLVLSLIHSLMVLPMMVSTFPIILGNASMSSIVGGGALDVMSSTDSLKAIMTLIWGVLITNSIVEAGLAAVIGGIVTDRLVNYLDSKKLIKDLTGE